MNARPHILTLAALLCSALPASVLGQTYTSPEDVETLDGIIKAYYEVVSGPAGQPRDWARDSSLHHPEAQVVVIGNAEDGAPKAQVTTLGDFQQSANDLAERGFFEYEVHRQTQRHGAVAHVWSTYEWRSTEDGPVGGRGVNSIQLFHDGERWWITGWMFDGRGDAPPVPAEYLPGGKSR